MKEREEEEERERETKTNPSLEYVEFVLFNFAVTYFVGELVTDTNNFYIFIVIKTCYGISFGTISYGTLINRNLKRSTRLKQKI